MSEYAAYVGWDWADREHVIELREGSGESGETMTIEGRPEALHEWAATMKRRYGGGSIAVCVETSRGAVIWALLAYEHIVLYPVNPKSAADFRGSLYPSGKKDDPVDAGILCELVQKHHSKLRPFEPADPATRSLAMLSEHRRRLVGQMVRLVQQLGSNLKTYFPQALELAGELGTPMACDFLERWPSLPGLQRSREETIKKFYLQHRSRSEERIQARLDAIRSAVALTDDRAVVECGEIRTRSLVALLRAQLQAIAMVEQELAARYEQHPERKLIDSFPGLGNVLGPRIVAILGSDRSRFVSAEELQRFTGIAPITSRSGGRDGTVSVHRRMKRSKFLHQTVVEWAGSAVRYCPWAAAYYHGQIERGRSRYVVLRALGYKLLRILFHCWKLGIPYNEAKHQETLKIHRSPTAARLAA